MKTNIKIRVDEELNNALQKYAESLNKTASEVVIEAIKEKLGSDYDYCTALDAYDSVDTSDTTTLANMCAQTGIEYDKL